MKWIPIFHQMTEIREKLDSIYKVDNQWKYRPRKEGFNFFSSKIFYQFYSFRRLKFREMESQYCDSDCRTA